MQQRPSLKPLTGVRFVAAAHVMAFHYADPLLDSAPAPLRNIVDAGYVGVELFFILSGFILAYSYSELTETSADRARFWRARVGRVLPNYFAALVLSGPAVLVPILAARHGAHSVGSAAASGLASALLLQAWIPTWAMVWNAPGWSLSVEAFFYAVFPFVLPRVRAVWRAGIALGATWGAALLFPLAYLALHPGQLANRWDDPVLEAIKFLPVVHLPKFVFGVVLGLVFVRRPQLPRAQGAAMSVGAAVALLLVLSVSDRIPYVLLHSGVLVPLFGALIFGLATGGGPLAWLLSRPKAVLLGEASYALYIFQEPLVQWGGSLAKRAGVVPSGAGYALALMTGLVAASVLVLKVFEEPLRVRLTRRLVTPRVRPELPLAR
jgi:peptidoglycan/LPS O-acetylase OafA/YrhL